MKERNGKAFCSCNVYWNIISNQKRWGHAQKLDYFAQLHIINKHQQKDHHTSIVDKFRKGQVQQLYEAPNLTQEISFNFTMQIQLETNFKKIPRANGWKNSLCKSEIVNIKNKIKNTMIKLTLGYGIAKKIAFKFGIMSRDPPNVLGKQEQTRKGCINQCFWSKF